MAEPALFDAPLYAWMLELTQIGNEAVHAAQERNRHQGIPNAYSHRGRLYFELPTGELTVDNPFLKDQHLTSAGV